MDEKWIMMNELIYKSKIKLDEILHFYDQL